MEKLNVFFIIVIFIYLFYSYIKSRPKIKSENNDLVSAGTPLFENKEKKVTDYEIFAVTAAIAAVMEGIPFKIRTIFSADEKKTGKKTSSWKLAGRQHNMMRRERLK